MMSTAQNAHWDSFQLSCEGPEGGLLWTGQQTRKPHRGPKAESFSLQVNNLRFKYIKHKLTGCCIRGVVLSGACSV